MLESDEVEERLRWALGKLPRWAVRVDAGGMWVAVSPTYDLDGLVIHGRSAEELVHRVQVQVCVEALALDRAGRRPPGGVLCGVDFTGLVAEPAAEPEADQFTIRTEGQLHLPGAVALREFLNPTPEGLSVLQNVVNGAIRDLLDRPSPSRGGIVPPGTPSPLPTPGDPPPSVLGPAQASRLSVRPGSVLRLVPVNGVGSNPTMVDADPPKPPKPVIPEGRAFGFEGDPCPECGLMAMVRNGSCLKCTSCGATTGCS